MNFDLRLPLGLMFTLFGAMLTVYGFVTDAAKDKADEDPKSKKIRFEISGKVKGGGG